MSRSVIHLVFNSHLVTCHVKLNLTIRTKHIYIAQKRQFEILIYGYNPENDDLLRYNTKIMIATQNFIYDTKRFKKNPPAPAPAPAP